MREGRNCGTRIVAFSYLFACLTGVTCISGFILNNFITAVVFFTAACVFDFSVAVAPAVRSRSDTRILSVLTAVIADFTSADSEFAGIFTVNNRAVRSVYNSVAAFRCFAGTAFIETTAWKDNVELFSTYSNSETGYTSWTTALSGQSGWLYFSYRKDGSANTGIDRYCINFSTTPSNISYGNTYSTTSNPSDKTCNSDCTFAGGGCYNAWCGDGTTNGLEACDSGSSNSDSYGNHCNAKCTGWAPYCGDGVVNGSEQCDGGSTSCSNVGDYNQGTATCTGSCTWNTANCSKSSGGC